MIKKQLPILQDSDEAEIVLKQQTGEVCRKSSRPSQNPSMFLRAFRRTPRFVKNVYKHRRGMDSLPTCLTHTTTFKCNYHCKEICDSPLVHQKMQKQPNGKDLTTHEIENIYKQLPQMDYVRFTGGEPTLRADYIELAHLAEIHLKPLTLHLTTNASHPDRVIRFAEERPRAVPLDLMISIDGVEEVHCRSRHNQNAYDRCIETLKELSNRQRELKLDIRVNQTVTGAKDFPEYRKLHQVLAPFKVRHQVVLAYEASATYSVERDCNLAPNEHELFKPVGQFTADELDAFCTEVLTDANTEMSAPDRWLQNYYIDGIRNRMNLNRAFPNPACVALSAHLRIFPNGDIPTCQFNSRIIGNLRQEEFSSIWSGESRKTQRQWVKNCVGCWAGCEVQANAVYTGDVLIPLRKK